MATSTFGKDFKIRPKVADEFAYEMKRTVPPTLTKDFHTKLTHVKDLKKELGKVLAK